MTDEAIAVFTARSPQRILREGGSQAWALNASRARKAQYLVCVQNQHNPDRDFSDATGAHGSVILVAKISDVIPAPEEPEGGRWMICFDEYSYLPPSPQPQDVWQGWRNPVRYTTLEEMGVELDNLIFHPAAELRDEQERSKPSPKPVTIDDGTVAPLSISQAKEGLAAFYGLETSAIEIVIRG
jgi:hypothetical protein